MTTDHDNTDELVNEMSEDEHRHRSGAAHRERRRDRLARRAARVAAGVTDALGALLPSPKPVPVPVPVRVHLPASRHRT